MYWDAQSAKRKILFVLFQAGWHPWDPLVWGGKWLDQELCCAVVCTGVAEELQYQWHQPAAFAWRDASSAVPAVCCVGVGPQLCTAVGVPTRPPSTRPRLPLLLDLGSCWRCGIHLATAIPPWGAYHHGASCQRTPSFHSCWSYQIRQ